MNINKEVFIKEMHKELHLSSEQGQEILNAYSVRAYNKNEMILEPSSFLLRQPTKENIQSLTESICLEMRYDRFQKLFSEIDSYRNWARSFLVFNYAQLKNRSIAQIVDPAKKRYLDLIADRPSIVQQAPLKHVATYLGITDTSLSRIRKEIAANK